MPRGDPVVVLAVQAEQHADLVGEVQGPLFAAAEKPRDDRGDRLRLAEVGEDRDQRRALPAHRALLEPDLLVGALAELAVGQVAGVVLVGRQGVVRLRRVAEFLAQDQIARGRQSSELVAAVEDIVQDFLWPWAPGEAADRTGGRDDGQFVGDHCPVQCEIQPHIASLIAQIQDDGVDAGRVGGQRLVGQGRDCPPERPGGEDADRGVVLAVVAQRDGDGPGEGVVLVDDLQAQDDLSQRPAFPRSKVSRA